MLSLPASLSGQELLESECWQGEGVGNAAVCADCRAQTNTSFTHTHTNELAPFGGSCAVGRLHLWNEAEFPPSIHEELLVGSQGPQSTSWRISSLAMDMGRAIICGVINMEMISGLIRMQQCCLLRRDVCTLQFERSDRCLNAVIKSTFKAPH